MGLFDMFGSAKPSENAKLIMDYLGCKCEYFPRSAEDDKLMAAYNAAVDDGKANGYTPIIVSVDDTLTEWFCDILHEDKPVKEFREELLSQSSEGGREVVEALAKQLEEEYDEGGDEMPDDEETGGGAEQDIFISYRSYNDNIINETILAYIPTDKPYEVFAWVPFGGWNECPEAADMIKIARYWYEQYGIVPAVIGHDTLECVADKPLSKETSAHAAKEVFAVCPDIVWQGIGSVGALADTLAKSTVWYFWWD